jgi:hypothetical protein
LLSQEVVELVGSLMASAAVDVRQGKVLLRRLAARRLPACVAWRPKREPLSEWLVGRWIAQSETVASLIERIRVSSLLSEFVDPRVVAAVADQIRKGVGPPRWLASAVVELGAVVEWVTLFEGLFRL